MTQLIFRPSFSLSHSMNDNFSDATTLDNERDTVNTQLYEDASKGSAIKLSFSGEDYYAWNDAGRYRDWETDRKSTRLNSSHITRSRMPSSA